MAYDDEKGARRQHGHRGEPGWCTVSASGPGKNKRQAQEGEAQRPEASSPFPNAESLVERGGCPVLQGRFLEVFQTVESGREPVSARHHLPWNLGVTRLVRLDQWIHGRGDEPQCREANPQKPTRG